MEVKGIVHGRRSGQSYVSAEGYCDKENLVSGVTTEQVAPRTPPTDAISLRCKTIKCEYFAVSEGYCTTCCISSVKHVTQASHGRRSVTAI